MENCENIKDILCLIVNLQRNTNCPNNDCEGCSRPFLGPNTFLTYNTRPIEFTSCQSEGLWSMPYTLNGTTGTSTTFRVENVDENCATFRILAEAPEGSTCPYILTNSYFTIDIDCILALKCLNDTCVS